MFLQDVFNNIAYDQINDVATTEFDLRHYENSFFEFWANHAQLPAKWLEVYTNYGLLRVLYNTRTNEVLALVTKSFIQRNGQEYIWHADRFHEDFYEAYRREEDWPAVTDCENDLLEKAYAILRNRKFSDDVVMHIDLDEDLIVTINKMAAESRISFDEMLTKILLEACDIAVDADGNYVKQD